MSYIVNITFHPYPRRRTPLATWQITGAALLLGVSITLLDPLSSAVPSYLLAFALGCSLYAIRLYPSNTPYGIIFSFGVASLLAFGIQTLSRLVNFLPSYATIVDSLRAMIISFTTPEQEPSQSVFEQYYTSFKNYFENNILPIFVD